MSESQPRAPEQKPKGASKPATKIEQIQALLDSMSPDERDQLDAAGVYIPAGDLKAVIERRYKFGVRCTECNRIALYFVGDNWKDPLGNESNVPPPVHHTQVSWTQTLPSTEIDRATPRCQHCKVPVRLNPDGSFCREGGRIIEVSAFEETRDQVFSKANLAKVRKEIASGGGQLGDVSSNYNAAPEKASATLNRLGEAAGIPNLVQQVAALAEANGASQALRSGFQG